MAPTARVVFALAMLIAAMCLHQAEAKIVEGHITSTNKNWVFVAKTVFSMDYGGNSQFSFNVSTQNPKAVLALYWDNYNSPQGSWFQVYGNNELTCQEKLSFAERLFAIPKSEFGVVGGDVIGDHSRTHIWWVAYADCTSENGVDFNYFMNFTNPVGGGWNYSPNLPFDEQGLPGLFLTYFLFYIFVVGAHIYAIIQLKKLESYHPVIQLLTLALGTEVAGIFLDLIHYGVYANNGVGAPGLHGLSVLLNFVNDITLSLMLILISFGWAVTTPSITQRQRFIVLGGMAFMALWYLILFIWVYAGVDPASTVYSYETWPGVIIVILRTIIMLGFIYNIIQTLKGEAMSSKRRFYIIFGIAYSIWFLIIPFATFIAAVVGYEAPWWQDRVVTGLKTTLDFFGLLGLVLLMWPNWARSYFMVTQGASLLSREGAFTSGIATAPGPVYSDDAEAQQNNL